MAGPGTALAWPAHTVPTMSPRAPRVPRLSELYHVPGLPQRPEQSHPMGRDGFARWAGLLLPHGALDGLPGRARTLLPGAVALLGTAGAVTSGHLWAALAGTAAALTAAAVTDAAVAGNRATPAELAATPATTAAAADGPVGPAGPVGLEALGAYLSGLTAGLGGPEMGPAAASPALATDDDLNADDEDDAEAGGGERARGAVVLPFRPRA